MLSAGDEMRGWRGEYCQVGSGGGWKDGAGGEEGCVCYLVVAWPECG